MTANPGAYSGNATTTISPWVPGDGKAPAGRSKAWGAAFVLAASVLWGTTGTAATFAPDVGPLAIGAVAMGLGGLLQATVGIRPLLRFRTLTAKNWPLLLLGGSAVALYPLAFYSSMHLAGVAVGTVVSIGSAPLASAIIERLMDRHQLGARWATAALAGIAGSTLLCLSGPEHDGAGSGNGPLGIALGLGAGVTYALYSWTAHRLMNRGVPSQAAMGAVFGAGGMLLLPVLFLTGAPLLDSWTNAAVGIYMALVPMFCGYVLFGWGLARVKASTATTLTLAEPAVAALLAVAIVGEKLPAVAWLGMVLVVASLAVLTLPLHLLVSRRMNRASAP